MPVPGCGSNGCTTSLVSARAVLHLVVKETYNKLSPLMADTERACFAWERKSARGSRRPLLQRPLLLELRAGRSHCERFSRSGTHCLVESQSPLTEHAH